MMSGVLRGDWGYSGYVADDWGAVTRINTGHHFVNSTSVGVPTVIVQRLLLIF